MAKAVSKTEVTVNLTETEAICLATLLCALTREDVRHIMEQQKCFLVSAPSIYNVLLDGDVALKVILAGAIGNESIFKKTEDGPTR